MKGLQLITLVHLFQAGQHALDTHKKYPCDQGCGTDIADKRNVSCTSPQVGRASMPSP